MGALEFSKMELTSKFIQSTIGDEVIEMERKKSSLVREQGHTYEDYADLPEELGRFELLDGELLAMSPGPSLVHQLASSLFQRIMYECDDQYIVCNAPVNVILSRYTTLQPDIVMVSKERMHIVTERAVEGPPDLVVEILSPSTVRKDRGKKMALYAHYEVSEYWIVDMANESVEQYLLKNTNYELFAVFRDDDNVASPTIPCIQFNISDVFSRLRDLRSRMGDSTADVVER